MYVTPQDETRLTEALTAIESKAGVQVLTALVGKSDAYPEAPWKAFALAVSISALVLTVQAFLDPPWFVPLHAALFALVVLGVGAAAALMTVFVPTIARLFVSAGRRDVEVEQAARVMFLDRRLYGTRERAGILIYVSLFERKIVILPDDGISARVQRAALADVVARMSPLLARGQHLAALESGLGELERVLIVAGFTGSPGGTDEIRDELIQEKGAGK